MDTVHPALARNLSGLVPVLSVERAFPAQAGRPWLPRGVTWGLGVLWAALGVARFVFFGENRGVQSGSEFAVQAGVAKPALRDRVQIVISAYERGLIRPASGSGGW